MLKHITRDNSSPDKKSKIYFCCHPDDYDIACFTAASHLTVCFI